MIPQGNSKYAPWLPLEKGMIVKVLTEAKPSENEKLKSPFYCDVEYKGQTYAIGFSWSAYKNISSHDMFGPDTENWIGREIVYQGKEKVKAKQGMVMAHAWYPVETKIDLNEKTPF